MSVSQPWRVFWWYQGRYSTTSYGSEESARKVAAALRARGLRNVGVEPV